jgi:hypothetical protein
LKSRMRENLTSGSVRGLIATSELLLQQEAGYEFYLKPATVGYAGRKSISGVYCRRFSKKTKPD